MKINNLLKKIHDTLPESYMITIELEKGYSNVTVTYPYTDAYVDINIENDDLESAIMKAIKYANKDKK